MEGEFDVAARLALVHRNAPGLLGQLSGVMGKYDVNISRQANASCGEVRTMTLC